MNSSVVPIPETSSPANDDVAQPGSTASPTSLTPVPALPPSFLHAEEEVRELAMVIRRMHAADKRYREESKFLLLRNEVALQTLLQNNLTSTEQKAHHGQVKEEGEEWDNPEGESPCFLKRKAGAKQAVRQQRISTVDSFQEQNLTALHAFDVHLIEDRIDKARSDLSTLEQQTRQIETEMQTLQLELAKLKDQLRRTQLHKAIP